MKIKPRPSGKKKVKSRAYHSWLVEEKIKSTGRLAQLNKANKKTKRPSEFLTMAIAIDNKEVGRGSS